MTDPAHIRAVAGRFKAEGLRPLVVEPMPNSVHDHIKRADALRDASIEKVLQMIPLLAENGFTTICTNFVAEVGWYRTRSDYPERGGALATAFCLEDAKIDPSLTVSEQALWDRLSYFLDAVVPQAERCGIRIALHPDDPPAKARRTQPDSDFVRCDAEGNRPSQERLSRHYDVPGKFRRDGRRRLRMH